jgi:hypothetical protein
VHEYYVDLLCDRHVSGAISDGQKRAEGKNKRWAFLNMAGYFRVSRLAEEK